jgi:hypothetical protein
VCVCSNGTAVPFEATFCSADTQFALNAATSACGWKN